VKARAFDAEMLDSFYAECRRCRRPCTNRRAIDHRVPGEHEPGDGVPSAPGGPKLLGDVDAVAAGPYAWRHVWHAPR
jgi:hypothetical protein